MDKIAANSHFVSLRKEVKKAKAMVAGNLIRKINKLKQEKDKLSDEDQQKKSDDKIDKIHTETKLLKTLDSYLICKKATVNPDKKFWNDIISNTKSTAEERLIARIICKNNIQKQVAKFRSDHKECDEWLTEYLEYRDKKKELKEAQASTKVVKTKKHSNKSQDAQKQTTGHRNLSKVAEKRNKINKNNGSPLKRHNDSSMKSDNDDQEPEHLHPSWQSKRKEKELLKAALSGQMQPKRIILNKD